MASMNATTPPDLNLIPAAPAPPGEVNNLVDAYTKNPQIVACTAVCLSFVIPLLTIKIFTKAYVVRNMQIEDYSLIISACTLIPFCGILLWLGDVGQGKHVWNVSEAQIIQFAFGENYIEILYPICMFFAKFSVLKQQERIFTGIKKDWIYWTIQVMIFGNLCFAISIFVSFIAACIPRAKLANPTLDGTCINPYVSILATSGINIVSDWACLILPAIAVSRLNLKFKQKLGVTAIFAVGLLACIASIVRLVYSVALSRSNDYTWTVEDVGIWAVVEFSTVILAACFPSIPRFVKWLKHGKAGSNTARNSGPGAGYQKERNTGPNSYRMNPFASKDNNLDADEIHKLHSPITVTYEYNVRSLA